MGVPSKAPKFASDAFQTKSVPSQFADKVRWTGGSLPPRFLAWVATAVVLLAVCIAGWIYAPRQHRV
jgi:hypothetical protein